MSICEQHHTSSIRLISSDIQSKQQQIVTARLFIVKLQNTHSQYQIIFYILVTFSHAKIIEFLS